MTISLFPLARVCCFGEALGQLEFILQGLGGRLRRGVGGQAEQVPLLALVAVLPDVPAIVLVLGRKWKQGIAAHGLYFCSPSPSAAPTL